MYIISFDVCLVAQSCLILCNPMDCSPPGSSVHGDAPGKNAGVGCHEHEVTDDQVNAIAEQLYCPVCENIPLDVCGTQACADWRDEIRQMLHEGRSEAEIKAYFVERYGRRVLATPAVSGIDIVVWVLPFVVVVGGIGVLVVQLRRMAPHKAAAQEAAPAQAVSYEGLDPEYVERLERELREFVGQSG